MDMNFELSGLPGRSKDKVTKEGQRLIDSGQDKFSLPCSQAEKAVRRSDEKYRSLVENLPEVIWTTDCQGNIIFISPNVEKVYGYSPEEIYKQGDRLWFGRVHPNDIQKVKDVYKALFEKQIRFDIEYRIKKKDGKWIWLHDRAIVTYERDGAMYAAGIFSDITDRKKAEKSLRKSEERWRSLANNAPSLVIVVDRDGIIEFINRTPPGSTVEDAISRKIYDYIDPKHRSVAREAIKQVFQTGESTRYENIAPGPYGRDSWYETQVGAIKRDGRVVAATLFATDITDRKRIKAELGNYREKVLQAQKHAYVGWMGAIVAHELNQPLTAINMRLGRVLELVLAQNNCCPSALKEIEESLTEAKKAASIIHKFREYSKDPALATTAKVNLSSTANRIMSMLSERAEQARINISAKSLDDLPEVEISETALEQIFLIIIQNAIGATDGRKQHRLNIAGGFTDSKIELQFSDDCCGIAPENLDKIFEPFFSTKSDGKGLGLGLDIVQQILGSYGGAIRVESQLGKGATFYVTLPISNNLKSQKYNEK